MFLLPLREQTNDVSFSEIGKKATGPFLVNIWEAMLFFESLAWSIMVVKAWLL